MENDPRSTPSNGSDRPGSVFRSKGFNLSLKIFVALIIALMIFQLGMFVGFRKASFAFGWGDNYHRVFGGPRGGALRDFAGQDFVGGHGTAGVVAKIVDNTMIIKSGGDAEKAIIVTDDTKISAGRATIGINNIKIGDQLTVIGKPNADGTITAEIIRMFGQAFDMNVPPPFLPPNN